MMDEGDMQRQQRRLEQLAAAKHEREESERKARDDAAKNQGENNENE